MTTFTLSSFQPFLLLLTVSSTLAIASDFIFLNCGSSESSTTSDGRNWTGDSTSTVTITPNTLQLHVQTLDSSVPNLPYATARVSSSPFTFSFLLPPGRKLIRLHFYAADYGNYSAADALFSVNSGRHTLLKNFSVLQTSQSLVISYIVREYSINSSSPLINLTFTPSSSLPSSYAFINGIELVSSPDIFSGSMPLITNTHRTQPYKVEPVWALQTMYRLNVGGNFIGPMEDSGLFRSWEDDSIYIYGAGFGVTYAADSNVSIRYPSKIPEFIAPLEVYATARSMGPDPEINLNYNLTWILPVDPGYYYLLRFHFCEIQYPITLENQRVFDIFIYNHTAIEDFDVILESGGIGVPTYRDFVVAIPKEAESPAMVDLWVALHPERNTQPEYYDAILNGLEVFKLEAYGDTLAGANPVVSRIPTGDQNTNPITIIINSKNVKIRSLVGSAVGVGGLVVALAIFTLVYFLHSKGKESLSLNPRLADQWKVTSSTGCRQFSFADLELATDSFDEARIIGVGGFGKVYRGTIDGGAKTIAIKRGDSISGQGIEEFRNENEMLSKLRHHHLVSLLGYCHDSAELILVYDYMALGNLGEHIYGKKKIPPIPWERRLEICIAAAKGIHYLHTGVKPAIIHRDVKTSNILLDEGWVAKISDFGLSKSGPEEVGQSHVSSAVRGTMGYLDPEYIMLMQLTEKSDVYAFGVVMLEVILGRPALDPANAEEENLVDWMRQCWREGDVESVLDPCLRGSVGESCLKMFMRTAESCVANRRDERPAMGNVLRDLELALSLQMQEFAEESINEESQQLVG
ncbi:receptor-like protein kinase FERONIA [Phalaenopsis equestris]|uniref:receptor-like protein kinase FERONIA n=1 Tax=Phalaenopsis equestris TaxID=78828 RepID=UPI0009E5B6FF|nr:receptor-like protein kinase FERONIA [Phalaenopsis equestris]